MHGAVVELCLFRPTMQPNNISCRACISFCAIRLQSLSRKITDIPDLSRNFPLSYNLSDHKTSRLSAEEYIDIQRHPVIGAEIIRKVQISLGNMPILQSAYEVTVGHHERFDGTGYPNSLKGWQIPLAARLMSIVDVYEALTSKRAYKEALSHAQALEVMTQNMQGHFDPAILERFYKMDCAHG